MMPAADHRLIRERPLPSATPALVAVVTNRRDWQRLHTEGWYRIPVRRAPQPLAAEYLAFYCTRAIPEEAWRVAWYAPVTRYRLLRRRELLPAEADHPRAEDHYYRIDLGPLCRLPRPIPSRRLRRITFIPTTFEQLLCAEELTALWHADDLSALLWSDFRDAVLKGTRRLHLEELPACD